VLATLGRVVREKKIGVDIMKKAIQDLESIREAKPGHQLNSAARTKTGKEWNQ